MKRVEGITDVTMTFGPYDGVAILEAGDIKVIGRIIHRRIQPIPGVLETLTSLAIESD